MTIHRIFVTVGTTEFNDLIDVILDDTTLTQLKRYNCGQLIIQYGTGKAIERSTIERIHQKYSIDLVCYRLKPNILVDINASDLVISHAGAGSCIEVLNAKKPLITVVNTKLMNNHQTELAQQLHSDGYLLFCTPNTFHDTISELNQKLPSLQTYEPGNMHKFISHLNCIMGFE